jgi:serine/threonine protein kinase
MNPQSPVQVYKYGTQEMTPPELLFPTLVAPDLNNNHRNPNHPKTTDGRSADVFALGILLFTLLHGPGKFPKGISQFPLKELQEGKLGGFYPLGDMDIYRLDRGAVELIRGMTMLDPRERWSMDDVVVHPWLN